MIAQRCHLLQAGCVPGAACPSSWCDPRHHGGVQRVTSPSAVPVVSVLRAQGMKKIDTVYWNWMRPSALWEAGKEAHISKSRLGTD